MPLEGWVMGHGVHSCESANGFPTQLFSAIIVEVTFSENVLMGPIFNYAWHWNHRALRRKLLFSAIIVEATLSESVLMGPIFNYAWHWNHRALQRKLVHSDTDT
eukprot:scaffold1223_cov119-Cylindrotheca_fusiformis.AAC.22